MTVREKRVNMLEYCEHWKSSILRDTAAKCAIYVCPCGRKQSKNLRAHPPRGYNNLSFLPFHSRVSEPKCHAESTRDPHSCVRTRFSDYEIPRVV